MTTYSCSAVRGAVGVCVAAGWRGRVSWQGMWGSSCAGHAATGPMVMAPYVDASAVRSAGLCCLSPAVSPARCLQAAVQATAPQFLRSGSAPSALLLPLCCTVVAMSTGGPCCSASGIFSGGRAGGAGCGKLCSPKRSGCVWYGFCRRPSGAARGGRGVGAVTSGPARWTGCGVLATVQPRLPGVRPRRGAATLGGPGGLTCPQAG